MALYPQVYLFSLQSDLVRRLMQDLVLTEFVLSVCVASDAARTDDEREGGGGCTTLGCTQCQLAAQ